jgi:hypothetical protein
VTDVSPVIVTVPIDPVPDDAMSAPFPPTPVPAT